MSLRLAGLFVDHAVRQRDVIEAWTGNPAACNLVNADGLPATPCRTDTW